MHYLIQPLNAHRYATKAAKQEKNHEDFSARGSLFGNQGHSIEATVAAGGSDGLL